MILKMFRLRSFQNYLFNTLQYISHEDKNTVFIVTKWNLKTPTNVLRLLNEDFEAYSFEERFTTVGE